MPLVCGLLALGAAVVDVLDGQIELVFMRLGGAAEFRAAVGQHAAELDVVLVEERPHTVVEQVGGGLVCGRRAGRRAPARRTRSAPGRSRRASIRRVRGRGVRDPIPF
jgi:hypothetical protein